MLLDSFYSELGINSESDLTLRNMMQIEDLLIGYGFTLRYYVNSQGKRCIDAQSPVASCFSRMEGFGSTKEECFWHLLEKVCKESPDSLRTVLIYGIQDIFVKGSKDG